MRQGICYFVCGRALALFGTWEREIWEVEVGGILWYSLEYACLYNMTDTLKSLFFASIE